MRPNLGLHRRGEAKSDTIDEILHRVHAFAHFRGLAPDKGYTSPEAQDAITLAGEVDRLRRDNERLQKAHDHQYEMAGLMLREAERYGRELAEAKELLREAAGGTYWLTPAWSDRVHAFLAGK